MGEAAGARLHARTRVLGGRWAATRVSREPRARAALAAGARRARGARAHADGVGDPGPRALGRIHGACAAAAGECRQRDRQLARRGCSVARCLRPRHRRPRRLARSRAYLRRSLPSAAAVRRPAGGHRRGDARAAGGRGGGTAAGSRSRRRHRRDRDREGRRRQAPRAPRQSRGGGLLARPSDVKGCYRQSAGCDSHAGAWQSESLHRASRPRGGGPPAVRSSHHARGQAGGARVAWGRAHHREGAEGDAGGDRDRDGSPRAGRSLTRAAVGRRRRGGDVLGAGALRRGRAPRGGRTGRRDRGEHGPRGDRSADEGRGNAAAAGPRPGRLARAASGDSPCRQGPHRQGTCRDHHRTGDPRPTAGRLSRRTATRAAVAGGLAAEVPVGR